MTTDPRLPVSRLASVTSLTENGYDAHRERSSAEKVTMSQDAALHGAFMLLSGQVVERLTFGQSFTRSSPVKGTLNTVTSTLRQYSGLTHKD